MTLDPHNNISTNKKQTHPTIIYDPSTMVQIRASLRNEGHTTLISKVVPKHINNAMEDEHSWWPCKKNLINSKRTMFGRLCNYPKVRTLGAKWVFKKVQQLKLDNLLLIAKVFFRSLDIISCFRTNNLTSTATNISVHHT